MLPSAKRCVPVFAAGMLTDVKSPTTLKDLYVTLKTWPFTFSSQGQQEATTCYHHSLVTSSSSSYLPLFLLSYQRAVFFITSQATVDYFFLYDTLCSFSLHDPQSPSSSNISGSFRNCCSPPWLVGVEGTYVFPSPGPMANHNHLPAEPLQTLPNFFLQDLSES